MAREKKKGQSGAAKAFITRKQALKQLQVSLPVFRKLCILKGIYPRDPSKKAQGRNKTYYLAKDILWLSHDPIIDKFRQWRSWKRKVERAKAKQEEESLQKLYTNKPRYRLDYTIRERYPTFIDAIQDMDDALNMICLYANLHQTAKIKGTRIQNCQRLRNEFMAYIAQTRSLRAAFVSIKGIYYQASVHGQTVTWLVPFAFPQNMPKKVDYRVMMSFLELYETLLGFINFKLYQDIGYSYPPKYNNKYFKLGFEFLSVLFSPLKQQTAAQKISSSASSSASSSNSSKKNMKKVKKQIESLPEKLKEIEAKVKTSKKGNEDKAADAMQVVVEEDKALDEVDEDQVFERTTVNTNLFGDCCFFLSRETPIFALSFAIRSFGGLVFWDRDDMEDDSEVTEEWRSSTDSRITHYVVDRPSLPEVLKGRDYVQPQWIFDCINAGILLPVEDYLMGVKLPAHLSPFVDDAEEGYIPKQRKKINKLIESAKGKPLANRAQNETEEVVDYPSEDEDEEQYQAELRAERKGISYSEAPAKKPSKKPVVESASDKESDSEDDIPMDTEENAMKAMMIESRKKRRLYNRIKYSQKQKAEKNQTLLAKRKAHEEREKEQKKPKKAKVEEPKRKEQEATPRRRSKRNANKRT